MSLIRPFQTLIEQKKKKRLTGEKKTLIVTSFRTQDIVFVVTFLTFQYGIGKKKKKIAPKHTSYFHP